MWNPSQAAYKGVGSQVCGVELRVFWEWGWDLLVPEKVGKKLPTLPEKTGLWEAGRATASRELPGTQFKLLWMVRLQVLWAAQRTAVTLQAQIGLVKQELGKQAE